MPDSQIGPPIRRLIAGLLVLGVGFTVPIVAAAAPALASATTQASPAVQQPWPKGRPFNPDVPSAAFGWLPAGNWYRTGEANEKVLQLRADQFKLGKPTQYWILNVYPPHQCTLAHKHLDCKYAGGAADDRAPDINGHSAYWISGGAYFVTLAFNYAPGGWAFLGYQDLQNLRASIDHARAVKIAEHVRFGTTKRVHFAVELTNMPAHWQVYEVFYTPAAGRLEATSYQVAPITKNPLTGDWQYPLDTPGIEAIPASHRLVCETYGGKITHRVINGHKVTVDDESPGSRSPVWQLCAQDADGLFIDMFQQGRRTAFTVTSLFAHHFRLLGRNPAHWTTQPVR
jgi:hypothetical protein